MTNSQRIIEISKKLKLSHIGSNLSCLPILEEIYAKKRSEDKVFLSGAHAHLAHLLVRQKYENKMLVPEEIIKLNIHCDRYDGTCDFTGGSLGHLGIALGYAIANPNITVYAIITDGSFCEGSEMETLRIAKMLDIKNLEIHANFNSYTAVQQIDIDYFERIIKGLGYPVIIHRTDNTEDFAGVAGHYRIL